MPFGERALFSGAMTGGASFSAASSGDNSASTGFSLGLATASGVPSGLPLASFLSVFLSDDLLSDLSAGGSRVAPRSSRPSITTMASGFSLARMPLAAAAQSAGSPLGGYVDTPAT